MHHGRRRILLSLGLGLMAVALIFPIGAAARERRTVPADVLGAHVWTGELCDGTDVSVAYHVTERGRLVFDDATGAKARVFGNRHWFRVRFVGQHLRVAVWTHWREGVLHLHTNVRQADCEPTPDDDPPPVDDGGNGQTG